MSDEILFLQPISALSYAPNIVNGQALETSIFNADGVVLSALTNSATESLVVGNVADAIANASATFTSESEVPLLLAMAEASGIGLDGPYEGSSSSNTEVLVAFDVTNGQPLSFSFSAVLELLAKEIENPDAEYNQATATTSFLIFNTSNGASELLDYLIIQGNVVTSEQVGEIEIDGSDVILDAPSFEPIVFANVDGDDGIDFLQSEVSGVYERTFDASISEITIVHLQTIETTFAGDTLIGNLGADVQYGTISADQLNGNGNDNKIYGSLGNDRITGQSGDDILEGGRGDDTIYGNAGDDQINGGAGDDRIKPNKGSDIIAGGSGSDLFLFGSFRSDEIDTILDFEVGLDKIQLISFGNAAKRQLFDTIQDTAAGAQLTFKSGGQLLIAGQTADSLDSASTLFV